MKGTTLKNLFQTSVWFLKRPALYPEYVRFIKKAVEKKKKGTAYTEKLQHEKEEARQWCEQLVIPEKDAITKITEGKYTNVASLFPEVFTTSNKLATACPVTMGGPGAVNLLYNVCEFTKAKKVIETGVAYGWSSLAILLSLSTREDAQLMSTDMPYRNRNNEEYVGVVVPENLKKYWEIVRQPDREALPKILSKMKKDVDVCHYDSDKSYAGRMWAYPMLWDILRKNGIFISDDIDDNSGFKDFCRTLNKTPVIIKSSEKYVGIVVKS
jgi:predicted O-methyltransferase YrrM